MAAMAVKSGRAFLAAVVVLSAPAGAWACAACYGQSDAPMAQGKNWGILSLLGIIVAVLGGVAGFFVYLARKSAALAAAPADVLRPSATGAE